jgi:hypothetical protein
MTAYQIPLDSRMETRPDLGQEEVAKAVAVMGRPLQCDRPNQRCSLQDPTSSQGKDDNGTPGRRDWLQFRVLLGMSILEEGAASHELSLQRDCMHTPIFLLLYLTMTHRLLDFSRNPHSMPMAVDIRGT